MEEKNRMDLFEEELADMAARYGKNNQEGIKMALNLAQEEFGCVDSFCQSLIVSAFETNEKIVKTLIKFNPSIKESVVDYEVVCCSGPRCAKNGSMEVLKAVRNTLGIDFNEETPDGKVRLTTKNCFKQCGKGPNVMVNGKFYHEMNKEKAEKLMKSLLDD